MEQGKYILLGLADSFIVGLAVGTFEYTSTMKSEYSRIAEGNGLKLKVEELPDDIITDTVPSTSELTKLFGHLLDVA